MVEQSTPLQEKIKQEILTFIQQEQKRFESQKIGEKFMASLNIISEIIPQRLYLTNFNQADKEEKLEQLGITHILNIALNYKPFEPKITYYCINDISDFEEDGPKLKSYLPKIIDFIHNAIMDDKKVLVHCAAGISRSPTIIIAYLIVKWKLSLEFALKICKDKRPGICPNSGFIKLLGEVEQEIFAQKN